MIFPVIEDGIVKNFVARRFRGKGKRYEGPHNDEGYIRKSHLLWGLDDLKGTEYLWTSHFLVLVEGIFDAIALRNNAYPSVALLGKNISPTQIGKLTELTERGLKTVVVLLCDSGLKYLSTDLWL